MTSSGSIGVGSAVTCPWSPPRLKANASSVGVSVPSKAIGLYETVACPRPMLMLVGSLVKNGESVSTMV